MRKSIVKTPLLTLRNDLRYLLVSLPQEMQDLSINPFLTNVPPTEKPGSWFLLAKSLESTCGRGTF